MPRSRLEIQPLQGVSGSMVKPLERKASVPETTANPRPLHVLVADDDPSLRLALTLTFERRGHRVDAVADTDAARVLLARARPDVALVDAGMPRDGVALWRELANGPGALGAALLLTGDPGALGDLARHPRVVGKPFGFRALVERVEAMVASGGPDVSAPPSPDR